MEYTITYDRKGAEERVTVKGRLLRDVLQKFCKKCIEEDDTGIFFELEDADLNWLKKHPKFHTVHVAEGNYGIVLKDVKIHQEYRNQYLLDLRAKRELLGQTVEDMIRRTGTPDYKDRELGHRKVTIDEYARFMAVLEDIEEEYDEDGDSWFSEDF